MDNKLSDLKNLKANLKGNRFHTKKSLGQNFLVNEAIAINIVEGADLNPEDVVLEIGPGVGSLTRYIAPKVAKLIVVELDSKAIPILTKNTKEFTNIEIINKDILKVDLNEYFKNNPSGIKVVANLPYYITSPILMYLLKNEVDIESITVMVQKEVGERLLAEAGNKSYGILTLAVGYYATVEKIVDVPKENFHPVPKVDSMVVKLTIKARDKRLEKNEEVAFFQLIKAAFNTRRKNLVNSLAPLFSGDKNQVKSFLAKVDIDGNRRGETLSIEEYFRLSKVRSSENGFNSI